MEKQKAKQVPFIKDADPSMAFSYLESKSTAINTDKTWKSIRIENLVRQQVIDRDKADDLLKDKSTVELERVVGSPDFLPAHFLPLGADRSRCVCKIETFGVDYAGRSDAWAGTGQLVSKNILLTNHHVLNSLDVASNAVVLFEYEMGADGQPKKAVQYRLNPSRLFLTSPVENGLDFTFVWVEGEPGDKFGHSCLSRAQFAVMKSETANIIQHPDGRMKEVVLHNNKVQDVREMVVHYVSDTEGGSSGAFVFNNSWIPYALHHASKKVDGGKYVNEGIRISAIAAAVDTMIGDHGSRAMALEVSELFRGTDSSLGFFGALGRERAFEDKEGLERVVNSVRGEEHDIDVGFWNIEHFQNRFQDKLDLVAQVIVDMNLDVWAFEESSKAATDALVSLLKQRFNLDFKADYSEPNASGGKQTTTVIWNTKTVDGKKEAWPDEIDGWFRLHSQDFDEDEFEAVHGKIFDRYPGLFHFKAKNRPQGAAFDFYLVPVHLKAMSEGSMRRRMASAILGKAVQKMIEAGKDGDWVLGGDFNAELASEDFDKLSRKGMVALSATDEGNDELTYIKSPRSLIDHIFLSPNLSNVVDPFNDYMIVAAEKNIPQYVAKISDHRPVMVRFQLMRVQPEAVKSQRVPQELVKSVSDAVTLEAVTLPLIKDVKIEEVPIERHTVPPFKAEIVPGMKLSFSVDSNSDTGLRSVRVTVPGYNTFVMENFTANPPTLQYFHPATIYDMKEMKRVGPTNVGGTVMVTIEVFRHGQNGQNGPGVKTEIKFSMTIKAN